VFILAGLINLSNRDCFIWGLYGLFAMNLQAGLTLALAIDRLLAIRLAINYQWWSPVRYLFCACIPPLLFALLITGYGFATASNVFIIPVCMPPSSYNSSARILWTYSNALISILVIGIYAVAKISFRRMKRGSICDSSVELANRVLTTLSVVLWIYFLSWVSTIVTVTAIQRFLLQSTWQPVLEFWLVDTPIVFNSSANLFIYCARSRDFEMAIRNCCGDYWWWWGRRRTESSVVPVKVASSQ